MKPVFFVFCVMLHLVGCASEVHRTPVTLVSSSHQSPCTALRVRELVTIKLPTGYSKVIKQGSRWCFVGTTPQGDVFRPVDDVFTIEGANRHEAYLVVAAGYLVGFYLPGEGAFSPLPDKIQLKTE